MKSFFLKYFSFTPEERTIAYILFIALVIGLALHLQSKNTLRELERNPYDYTVFDQAFQEKLMMFRSIPESDSLAAATLNGLSREALETLPGIGPVLAQRIMDYRREFGPFRSIKEVELVPGIGPKRAAAIQEHLSFKKMQEMR